MNFEKKFLNLKKNTFYTLIFLYIVFMFVNFTHINMQWYEEVNLENQTNTETYFKLKINENAKINYSEQLASDETYDNFFNRECEITGNMHDRHKVRWLRMLTQKKIFSFASDLNKIAPYYLDILIHSLLIFISLILINNFFPLRDKYMFLLLLFITFIFQQKLGEHSFSIFDLFFCSAALCASKRSNGIIFVITCALATLNRETGFLIIFSWLIFNNNFRNFILIFIISSIPFFIINYDIVSCMINPKFFAPMEYQQGQINFSDLANANIFLATKTIMINYLIPFGLGLYFFMISENKNKYLLAIFLLYLFVFLIASPIHKMELRLIILPYLWIFIFLSKKNPNLSQSKTAG